MVTVWGMHAGTLGFPGLGTEIGGTQDPELVAPETKTLHNQSCLLQALATVRENNNTA